MNADTLIKLKILPRFMMLVSTGMAWNTAHWFMALPDPSAPQSAFVSVVMGAMTGIFGIWIGAEHKDVNVPSDTKK
tara:strand:+ start:20845 stop:21072 length:228 start_codon:yes stop_codon:yes gene_type:complete